MPDIAGSSIDSYRSVYYDIMVELRSSSLSFTYSLSTATSYYDVLLLLPRSVCLFVSLRFPITRCLTAGCGLGAWLDGYMRYYATMCNNIIILSYYCFYIALECRQKCAPATETLFVASR